MHIKLLAAICILFLVITTIYEIYFAVSCEDLGGKVVFDGLSVSITCMDTGDGLRCSPVQTPKFKCVGAMTEEDYNATLGDTP